MRNQKVLCQFKKKKKLLVWMKFSMLPQPAGLLKLMLNLFYSCNIQGRELMGFHDIHV